MVEMVPKKNRKKTKKKRHIVNRLLHFPQLVGLEANTGGQHKGTLKVPTSLIFISKYPSCHPICDSSLLCHSVHAQVRILPPDE
jgi:hypothetical protein